MNYLKTFTIVEILSMPLLSVLTWG